MLRLLIRQAKAITSLIPDCADELAEERAITGTHSEVVTDRPRCSRNSVK